MKRHCIVQITAFLFLAALFTSGRASAQLGFPLTIKKPKEYEERELRSEKTDLKKFTAPRRFIQNTVTHYNYYFNANNKLNEILFRAKTAYKDDYSQLLSFYNYTLDLTAQDSVQLDSITYKSSTGIALHDLRNDWVDNLYLLWGAAYYLRKDFDSAYLMFQYINYAFAPKEKDGYYLTIGSKRDGNSALSISTKEKRNIAQKIFSQPPSRNESFIWQIRNFLAQDELAEAASLIVTLRNDPNFPKRLQNDLDEVQAYWFYKQNIWDSSANHLINALDNAPTKAEKARWEYLAAQMFELSGNYKEAVHYYGKVSSHTTDPIMDIYARLYAIRANKDDGEKDIAKNVSELMKMAKRDKYTDYQDIIYYMAAQMEIDGGHVDEAVALLTKSTKVVSNNPAQRNRAFLQLGDLCFQRREFRLAANFYDSIQMSDTTIHNPQAISARRETAAGIATNQEVIARQDSLQRIAAMPEDQRKDFVKKLAKTLRKEQGLKEEYVAPANGLAPINNTPVTPTLFADNAKGEWYFYNSGMRNRGSAEFKAKWGNRPNSDNWRRSSVVGTMAGVAGQNNAGNNNKGDQNNGKNGQPEEITFDALYDKLPLREADLKHSNDSIAQALFNLGKLYQQELEDCGASVKTFSDLRSRFPEFKPMEDVIFGLYYCYTKSGDAAKAAAMKQLLNDQFASSRLTSIVNTGKDPENTSGSKSDATLAYERIYDLFIEGKFTEAIEQKKTADQVYGKHFWTPQLLYIEAVYYIKQRQDTTAKAVLNDLIGNFATHPLAGRASNLLQVLERRAQIEEELRNLQVTRYNDSVTQPVNKPAVTPPVVTVPVQPKKDTAVNKPVNNPVVTPPVQTQPTVSSPYTNAPDKAHFVVLVLNKVDPVFVNEARNAFNRYNAETYYNKPLTTELTTLDAENRLLLISSFANAADAISYVDKAKPVTPNDILPWLKNGKYSFLILTESNLEILQNNKDIENYRKFLNQQYPGKF